MLAVSLASTGLSRGCRLTKALVDEALVGRNLAALTRIVELFVVVGPSGSCSTS